MALLIFPPDNLAPPLAALLDHNLRKEVATRVNEALLLSQGERSKAKLYNLVRLRAWSEQKAREAKKDLPDKISLGLDPSKDNHERSQEGIHKNGDAEAMST